jgi:hypothetical protein
MKKVFQNIGKWDLVLKFLLSEIQWCVRNLILMFGLWFIDFLTWNPTLMSSLVEKYMSCMQKVKNPRGPRTQQRQVVFLSLKWRIEAPVCARYRFVLTLGSRKWVTIPDSKAMTIQTHGIQACKFQFQYYGLNADIQRQP